MATDLSKLSDLQLDQLEANLKTGAELKLDTFSDDQLGQAEEFLKASGPATPKLRQGGIGKAFGEGLKETITATAIRGAAGLADQKIDFIEPDPEFEARGVGENVAQFIGGLIDPALPGIFKVGGFLAKPLLARAAARVALPATVRTGKQLALVNKAITGGAQFGVLGAAQESARQLEDQNFDPAEIAKSALFDAGLGVILNPAFSAIIGKAGNSAASLKRFQRSFGGGPIKAVVVSQSDRFQAGVIHKKMVRLERQLKRQQAASSNQRLPTSQQSEAIIKSANIERQMGELENKFESTIQGPAFKAYVDARARYGNATMRGANGKKTFVWEQAVSPRGVVVPPEHMEVLARFKDISSRQAGQFSMQGMLRLIQSGEGIIGGPVQKMMFDGVAAADNLRIRFTNRLRERVNRQIKKLGVGIDDATQARLADAAENTSSAVYFNLSANEKQFVGFTARFYNQLLNQMNAVNAKMGLPLILKRKDYVTHFQELTLLQQLNLKPSVANIRGRTDKFARKIKTQVASEQKRTARESGKNLLKSIDIYIDPAARRITMQQAASEVQARATHLPKNMRKAVNAWVEGPVLGGVDLTDAAIKEAGFGGALKVASFISAVTTRGLIGGSFRVLAQQPSQIIATAMETGVKNTLKGLAKAHIQLPARLLKQSNFMLSRSARDELIPVTNQTLKKFDKFSSAILEFSDRYVARASWYAGFDKGKAMGLADDAAVRYADHIGRTLHASYQQLLKPAVLRGQKGKALLPFQTFSFNLWNRLVNDPKVIAELNGTTQLREVLKFAGSMLATNQLYDLMGLPTPFAMTAPTELSAGAFLQSAKDATGLVPIAGGFKFGIPSPVLSAVAEEAKGIIAPGDRNKSVVANVFKALLSDDEEVAEQAWQAVGKSVTKFLPAGNQVRNMVSGVQAARDGYFEVGDKVIDLDALDKAVAVLLGPTATGSARRFFNEQELKRIKSAIGRE